MFIDQDEVEAYKYANQERGQYPASLTEQAWSIKNLLYGFPGIPFFFAGHLIGVINYPNNPKTESIILLKSLFYHFFLITFNQLVKLSN